MFQMVRMFSSILVKLIKPLFYMVSSSQKLKFFVKLPSHPSSPSISSAMRLPRSFLFSFKFQQRSDDKNYLQFCLRSLKVNPMASSIILFQLKSMLWINNIQFLMIQKRVWLDCDPGHDDMLAIIMAAYSDQINLIGISTSAGNSYIQNTTQNTLNILYQIGKSDIQVIKGSPAPLSRKLKIAPQIHGFSGLQGAELLVSPHKATEDKPFLTIYNAIMAQPQKIEFVATGSLTNLAILLKAFPDIKTKIREITIMGGAIGQGNWSPAAEFNIVVDPEAASIVFREDLPITMIPLQVTHKVQVSQDIFKQFIKLPSSFGQKMSPLFRYFQKSYKQDQDFQFPVAHDPCTIYYLLHPEDFKTRKAFVQIQNEGNSRGRTNCRFMHFQKSAPNATVCVSANVANFWKAMLQCLKRIK